MATVASTTRFTTSTLASSTAGPFNVGFRLFESDAITVYVDGILNEDWTLTADLDSGYDDAATITFDAALDSGSVIWIEGSMIPQRSADYLNTEPRLTDKMNAELPRIWAALIEAVDRSKKSFRATTAIPPIDLTGDDDVTIIWKDGRLQIGPTANEVANAQGYAQAADAARDEAEQWAEEDEDSEVETGKYSAKHWAAKAAATALGLENFFVDPNDNTQAAINSAIAAGVDDVWIPDGTYEIASPIIPKSNVRVKAGKGVVLRQTGPALFDQTDADLEAFEWTGGIADYQHASPSADHWLIKLGDHRRCSIDIAFRNYASASLMLREATGLGNGNVVDNHYRLVPEATSDGLCKHGVVSIGKEGVSYKREGDGTASAIATGVAWPEQFNSSVVVLEWTPGSAPEEKNLTTDYTVSFDGSNNLTITPVSSIPTGTYWFIWPSQPISAGRTPITGNAFEIICDPSIEGYMPLRWVDGEDIRGRIRINADGGRAIRTNPFSNRGGQAGDYLKLDGLVIAYTSNVTGPSSVLGMDFGPGSLNNCGVALRMDRNWYSGGTYYGYEYIDKRRVALTGTVSGTSGSPTVTGTGTAFQDELTKVGDTDDLVEIDDNLYAISSIDSDTQITLSTNLSTSPSGATAYRYNKTNYNSGNLQFASMGNGTTNYDTGQVANFIWGTATEGVVPFTIASGNTTVTVRHGAFRAFNDDEYVIYPNGVLRDASGSLVTNRFLRVTAVNDTSATIGMQGGSHTDGISGYVRYTMQDA